MKGKNLNNSQNLNSQYLTQSEKLLEEALGNLKKGDFDKARSILNNLLVKNSKNHHALHLLGIVEIHFNEFDLAIKKIEEAIAIDPTSPDFHSSLGVALQKKGKLKEALNSYSNAINLNPNFVEAICNRGNVLKQLGEIENSVKDYDKALQIKPEYVRAHIEKAQTLHENNMYEKAIEAYEKILKFIPNSYETYLNIGDVYGKLKTYELALISYGNAIEINPGYQEAYLNQGNIYKEKGLELEAIKNYDEVLKINNRNISALNNKATLLQFINKNNEAINIYTKILNIDSDFELAYFGRAISYKELNNLEEAIRDLEKVIEINPNNSEAWCNKGEILNLTKDYLNAIIILDKAITINPYLAEAWSNKGYALLGCQKYSDAIMSFDRALTLKNEYPDALTNKGYALSCLKRYEEAIICHKKAIDLNPKMAQSHLNLSETYLSKGNFIEGWTEYEWRWDTKKYEGQKPKFTKPLWLGDRTQKTILIWAEQGLGDQVLYSSVFTELNLYVTNVIVALDKRLIALYQRSFPNFRFVDININISENEFDYQIPMGTVAKFFRSDIRDFKKSTFPYLIANEIKTTEILNKYKISGKIMCGISWRSANPDIGDFKSIPLNEFDTLLHLDQLNFINLQYKSEYRKECEISNYRVNINDIQDLDIYNDIDTLASVIQACDIVITCSNTTAHLAGALNKPTLLLLPAAAGRFWYWIDVEGQSIWYPSVKVLHQKTPGDWMHPIKIIENYLIKLPN